MLRDNPTGSSQQCLENPRPAGAELSLTEDVTSPFQAEPRQLLLPLLGIKWERTGPQLVISWISVNFRKIKPEKL
jgi:hypothetical protein